MKKKNEKSIVLPYLKAAVVGLLILITFIYLDERDKRVKNQLSIISGIEEARRIRQLELNSFLDGYQLCKTEYGITK